MGYPYHALVPVVILADNPGVNREELAHLFMQTNLYQGEVHYYSFASREWDGYFKSVWRPFKESDAMGTRGKRHTYTRAEQRAIISRHNLARWDNRQTFHQMYEWAARKEIEWLPALPYAEDIHKGLYSIGKLLGLKKTHHDYITWILYSPGWPEKRELVYDVERSRGGDITKRGETERFCSLDELGEKFPHLLPEAMFDFSQPSGKFNVSIKREANLPYRWHQTNGRYYFDQQHFVDTVHAGGDVLRPGYTDFVITREAVRAGAWKLLTYRGLSHLPNAFKRFPGIKKA